MTDSWVKKRGSKGIAGGCDDGRQFAQRNGRGFRRDSSPLGPDDDETKMGLMPELDVIGMLSSMMGVSTPVAGWIAHFVIGTIVWGILFVALEPSFPGGSHWVKGVVFGIGAWLLMMIAVMPRQERVPSN